MQEGRRRAPSPAQAVGGASRHHTPRGHARAHTNRGGLAFLRSEPRRSYPRLRNASGRAEGVARMPSDQGRRPHGPWASRGWGDTCTRLGSAHGPLAPHTGLDVPHAVREPRCGCVRREARRAGARRPRCMVRTERRLLANAAAGKGGGASGRPPGSPCHRCGSVGEPRSLCLQSRNSMESRKRCKLASSTALRGAATSRQYP